MLMKLKINDRAALAIKNNTKIVEIRDNKENGDHNYSLLKENDIIEFESKNLGIFYVKVKEVNHYESLDQLFTMEGTKYTSSSTDDKAEAIKNVNKLDGYSESIKQNGVYAIHIKYLYSENEIIKLVCVDSKGKVGSPCGACREYLMQLDKNSKNIEILRNEKTKETVRLEELIPDWWAYDRV